MEMPRQRMSADTRNMILLVRMGNLALAFLFFLMVIWPESWSYWAFSPSEKSPQPVPANVRAMILESIVCLWFISAMGSFLRSWLAWFGSLLGG